MAIRPEVMLAELLGTAALIFIGAGSGALGTAGLVGVAFAHGLTLACFAYAYGHISGTHINPAVTLGFVVSGRGQALALDDDEKDNARSVWISAVVNYWIPQLLGSLLGGVGLLLTIGGISNGKLGATLLAPGVSLVNGLALEAIMTFLLMNTILNVTDGKGTQGNMAPWAIGSTLTLCILMCGPLTGASLNPARTLGPNLFSGAFTLSHLLVYFVGPCLGASLAALLWILFDNLLPNKAKEEDAEQASFAASRGASGSHNSTFELSPTTSALEASASGKGKQAMEEGAQQA